MLDGDDVDFMALLFFPTSLVGFVFWLIMIVVLLFVVSENENECAEKMCPVNTTGILIENECLCVQKPLN